MATVPGAVLKTICKEDLAKNAVALSTWSNIDTQFFGLDVQQLRRDLTHQCTP